MPRAALKSYDHKCLINKVLMREIEPYLKSTTLAELSGLDINVATTRLFALKVLAMLVLPINSPPEEGLAGEAALSAVVHVANGLVEADQAQHSLVGVFFFAALAAPAPGGDPRRGPPGGRGLHRKLKNQTSHCRLPI